jgi:hypothetical protein
MVTSLVISIVSRGFKYFLGNHSLPGWLVALSASVAVWLSVLAVAQRRRIRSLQPRGTAVITPHQTNRPFWAMSKLASGEPAMHLRCDWYVRNTGTQPISVVGAYIGEERAEWHGQVETFISSEPGELLKAIEPDKTAELSCDFWITPRPVQRNMPFVTTVFLQDDLGGRYTKKLRFDYDGTPMRPAMWIS